jgi:metal-sulfur cluster biosynthetic enzyme
MPDDVAARELVARARERLNAIQDPCSLAQGFGVGMDDMGLVTGIEAIAAGEGRYALDVRLRTTAPACFSVPFFESAARAGLEALPGVASVTLTWGSPADWTDEDMAPDVRRRLAARRRLIVEHARTRGRDAGVPAAHRRAR